MELALRGLAGATRPDLGRQILECVDDEPATVVGVVKLDRLNDRPALLAGCRVAKADGQGPCGLAGQQPSRRQGVGAESTASLVEHLVAREEPIPARGEHLLRAGEAGHPGGRGVRVDQRAVVILDRDSRIDPVENRPEPAIDQGRAALGDVFDHQCPHCDHAPRSDPLQ